MEDFYPLPVLFYKMELMVKLNECFSQLFFSFHQILFAKAQILVFGISKHIFYCGNWRLWDIVKSSHDQELLQDLDCDH